MIQGIRRKFILIAVAVLSAAMVTLAAVINISNWIQVRGEIRETLADLAENAGNNGKTEKDGGRKGRNRHMQNALDESRYFTVHIFSNGAFSIADVSRSSGESEEEMTTIVREALNSGNRTGTKGHYMYLMTESGGKNAGVFLNIETKMDAVNNLLLLSGIACVGGILIASLLVFIFSKKAIQPLIRNAVQQKQFITDAGHELKTPLTVISANMDALELKTEPNEWIDSTREQLSGMGSLVNNMIYLSRMDEDGAALAREDVDLSELVQQEAGPFQGMADFMGKTMEIDTENGIRIQGDRQALGRMVNQLCDNAIKYSPDGDLIRISLKKSGREIRLAEENCLKEPLSKDALSHLFDRFYRPDASRSRASGGYGIGLSMVKAIVEKHDGQIKVETDEENHIRFIICFNS
jgi:K+-sensing histidine kinase KdpD